VSYSSVEEKNIKACNIFKNKKSANDTTVGVVLEEDNGEGGSITVIMDGIHFRNAWR
jgi:hypothetical protein